MRPVILRISKLVAVCGLFVGLGCDTNQRGRDASAHQGQGQKVAEISVRLEAPSGGSPSVSVLAFQAAVTGVSPGDVLSVVDPLVAPLPVAGCEERDVAGAARALGAQGGRVELDALSTFTLDLGAGAPYLRPSPRVYPDLASVVGGVVGEAGPLDISLAPSSLGLADTGGASDVVPVQALPRLLGEDGELLPASVVLPSDRDLVLEVVGPRSTFVELRPFGATFALACPVGEGRRLLISAAELERLNRSSGKVPLSVEAVSRETHWIRLTGGPVRLSIEVRSSSVIDLRP
jgi:hypothetical protein